MNIQRVLQNRTIKKNDAFSLSSSNFHNYSKSMNFSILAKKKATQQSHKGSFKENKAGGFRIQSINSSKYIKQPDKEEEKTELKRHHFKFHMIVGKGGFGKVWIVTYKTKKRYYALKEMSKTKIALKKSIQSVLNEKIILSQLTHEFIVNMKTAFQDRDHLYLVMDLLTGGDLRFHLCYNRRFSEVQTKFFIACLILSLEYIHSKAFIHRDIKPENIVFDEKGYMRLTDFGIARRWNPDNAKETSGTPGYMAPEVMCRQQHGYAVDYYAIGVIAYECMMGRRPYNGRSRKEIRDQILAKQVQVKPEELPEGWSFEGRDFVNSAIQRKPHKRLGFNGIEELKHHKWFKNFNWVGLEQKTMTPPFVPNVKHVFEYLRSITEEDSEDEINLKESNILRRPSIQEMFKEYDLDVQKTVQKRSKRESKEDIRQLATIRLNSAHRSLNTNKQRDLSSNISSRMSGRLDQIWKNLAKRKFN